MSELILPPKEVHSEARRYGRTMLEFVHATDFPESLLAHPDHLMIKSSGVSDFEKKVKSITPWAEEAAFLEVDERFLVAARLIMPIALTDYKEVDWVEIMEPKSVEGTVDYLGAEYAQFYHNDFNSVGVIMKKKRVDFEKRTDGMHRWWRVPMNDEGQEIRITDKPLAEIIGRELDDGTAKQLLLAA